MYLRYSPLLISVLLLATLHVHAQEFPSQDAGIQLTFKAKPDIQWRHTYSGLWENMHPVEVLLEYDGKSYLGTFHLVSGDVTFDLQGYQEEDGRVMLQEIDANGTTSGYLIAKIADGKMNAQWWSVDFTRSASLKLQSEEVVQLRKFQPEMIACQGSLGSTGLSCIIQREASDLLSGFLTLDGDAAHYRISGTCEDATCDKMQFNMESPGGKVGELSCLLQRGGTLKLEFAGDGGDIESGSAKLTGRYPMQRRNYAGYLGNIDCVYPVISSTGYDTWLGSQIEDWYAEMHNRMDSLQRSIERPGPEERWSIQASSWIDFTLVTPEYASGFLTSFNPDRNGYDRIAFIFNLKSGKPVSVRDLGRKALFEQVLRDDARLLKEADNDDPEYLDWLDKQELQHIAVAPDGFVLCTDFDPVFGDTWVKLRYEDYPESLKRNAFVHDLLLE